MAECEGWYDTIDTVPASKTHIILPVPKSRDWIGLILGTLHEQLLTGDYYQETGLSAMDMIEQIQEMFLNYEVRDTVSDLIVGEMKFIAGGQVPNGWFPCDGRTLPIASYPKLYEKITFDWSDTTEPSGHFRIPNLQGRSPMGAGTPDIAGAVNMVRGSKQGEQKHVQTAAEVGQHNHALTRIGGAAGALTGLTQASGQNFVNIPQTTQNNAAPVGMNVIHPVAVGLFIIYHGEI